MPDPVSTLPMHQILAQAPELSPWHGMEDNPGFDPTLSRTLDDLSAVDRMLAIKRIRGIRRREKDLLEAVASQGWVTWISHKWLQWATDRSESSVSHGLRSLKDEGLIRISPPRIAGDGSRIYLVTISGDAIIRGYAAHREGLLDVTSSKPMPDGSITGGEASPEPALIPDSTATGEGALDVTSSRPTPDGSITGGEAGSKPALMPDSTVSGEGLLDVTSSEVRPNAPEPAGAVSSFVDDIDLYSDYVEIINEQTNRAPERAHAQDPPDWWPLFLREFAFLQEPRPKRPSWKETLAFSDPADAELTVMQEACARFLDTYCRPGAPSVGRARGAIRAIYRSLLDQALRLPGGISEFASYCWATSYYLMPLPAEEAADWTGRVPGPPPPPSEPHRENWPTWYVRLREHFPDAPVYEYLAEKAAEFGLDNAMLLRTTELTIQGCRHPAGVLRYWLRACATSKTQSASAESPRGFGRVRRDHS